MRRGYQQLIATSYIRRCVVALVSLPVVLVLFHVYSRDAGSPILHLSQLTWPIFGVLTGVVGVALCLPVKIFRSILSTCRMETASKQPWLLQNVINAIPTPVFYKDTDGIYLGCNVAFEEFIGLSREQIVGKSVYDVSGCLSCCRRSVICFGR